MKKSFVLTIAIAGLINNLLFAQLSLDSCQSKARANYPLINQFDLIKQSEEYNLSNAGKNYLPQLNVTGIAGYMDGMPEISMPEQPASSSDNFKLIGLVQLNQTIWDGGATSNNKDIISAQSGIEVADIEVKLHTLKKRVNGIYFGLLLLDEQTKQLNILKANLKRNEKNVTTAIENGVASKSDLDELRVEILNAEQKILELSYNHAAYLKMLSLLIGEDLDENTTLLKPEMNDNFSHYTIERPELTLFEKQKLLVESQYNISKTSLYPKIGLMGFGLFLNPGVKIATAEMDHILMGGINLSWELGGLYKNSNNSDIAEIGLRKIASQKETFLFNTNLELSQTEQDIAKFKSLIEKDKEILELKRNLKKAYEVKYNNGTATMSNLLDRINDENVSYLNLIKDEIQYSMMVYQYKNISGN